ncbi:hypothetical protein ZIOFF_001417 [Zingiber officinale]|uniref:Chloride conductance regulatory protein ICln n=1 Tax=Zingiber officinale TaxID=94328 RepID=A0A8J5IMG3_ZINOF|nr:hypothetical protein ZIOFF_001417 [Zingiber officinale]
MVPGLQHFDDCVVDGNVRPRLDSDDSEELMHVFLGVAVALGSRPLESPGTLYVTTRRVIWLSDADRGKGYAVDFLSLSLHAVSRDREAYPFPCIYTQIETGDEDDEEESEDSYSEINGDLVLSKITEMRLVPSDAGKCILAIMHALSFVATFLCINLHKEITGLSFCAVGEYVKAILAGKHRWKFTTFGQLPSSSQLVDTLFDIFCQCAELNPEPCQREEENTWLFGDEGMSDAGNDTDWQLSENPANPIGYANGDHDLSRRVHELQIGSQQFEDADEGEQESHDYHHLAAN